MFRSFSKGIQPFSEATPARLAIHDTLKLPKPLQYLTLIKYAIARKYLLRISDKESRQKGW